MKPSELLSSPDKWTKGSSAKDIAGKAVNSHDKHAVCWCLLGAVYFCDPTFSEYRKNTNKLIISLSLYHTSDLVKWNDAPERTFEEVKQLLINNGL